MADRATSQQSRTRRWLWAAVPVFLVVGAAFATWQVNRSRALASVAAVTPPAAPALLSGHDYYLHVKLIEVTDRTPAGKAWDRVGGSGPDLRFSLTWHGNVIWKSSEKADTLIATWDLMKVDLRQIILAGGHTDLADLINAPLVRYAPGETVWLKVWDEDPIGSDDAGSLTLKLDDLHPGDNTLAPAAAREVKAKALKRVVVTMIDRRTPLPELVETVSNR